MARGGARAVSGPIKGTKYTKAKPIKSPPADIRKAARQSGVSPLDYMLAVMNDAAEDPQMRARMAIAAAPYVHARASDALGGKKEQQQDAAERVSADGKYATPPAPKVNNGMDDGAS